MVSQSLSGPPLTVAVGGDRLGLRKAVRYQKSVPAAGQERRDMARSGEG